MYYTTLNDYLKNKFGSKVIKLSLDGHNSCPNRINNQGGCIFCSSRGAGEFTFSDFNINRQVEFQKLLCQRSGSQINLLHTFKILRTLMVI